jgi:hypothetical protein
MTEVKQHQDSLKFLVIVQAACLLFGLIALFSFPEPEEITAALTVMEELEPSEFGFSMFVGLSLILVTMILWVWSLWQLYHLNQKGFTKFVWAMVLGCIGSFMTDGGWSTPMVGAIDAISLLSAGAILYIGFFFSNAFNDFTPEGQTGEDKATPVQEQVSNDNQ